MGVLGLRRIGAPRKIPELGLMKFLRRHPILTALGGIIAWLGGYVTYIGYTEARGREALFPAYTAMELHRCWSNWDKAAPLNEYRRLIDALVDEYELVLNAIEQHAVKGDFEMPHDGWCDLAVADARKLVAAKEEETRARHERWTARALSATATLERCASQPADVLLQRRLASAAARMRREFHYDDKAVGAATPMGDCREAASFAQSAFWSIDHPD
jgi:hypothetical protein